LKDTFSGVNDLAKSSLFNIFRDTGRDIFLRGLISSHAGNMSVLVGNMVHITKRGSMLGRLKPADIIKLELEEDNPNLSQASSETVVHRAIYKKTDALAVMHAHPPYANLLSMTEDALIPIDSEGSFLFKKVPVVSPKNTIASEEAANIVSKYLKDYKIVLVRGHGSFARGATLEETHMFTSSLESSAFFLYHLNKMQAMYKYFQH
jgi:L-fuculose-phosphate aldolase